MNITINNNASGDSTISAAPGAGFRQRAMAFDLIADSDVTVTFKTGSGATIAGPYTLTQASGMVCPVKDGGWFETGINEALVMNLSGAVRVTGHVDVKKRYSA